MLILKIGKPRRFAYVGNCPFVLLQLRYPKFRANP